MNSSATVENVVCHNPSRYDNDRFRPHLRSRRGVLNDFGQACSTDNLSWSDRDRLAETVGLCASRWPTCCDTREVIHEVSPAVHKVHSAFATRLRENLRITQHKVRWRCHIEELARDEGHQLLHGAHSARGRRSSPFPTSAPETESYARNIVGERCPVLSAKSVVVR